MSPLLRSRGVGGVSRWSISFFYLDIKCYKKNREHHNLGMGSIPDGDDHFRYSFVRGPFRQNQSPFPHCRVPPLWSSM